MAKVPDAVCSIERTLGVLGERWTFLILREAFLGAARFVEFRDRLGVAPENASRRIRNVHRSPSTHRLRAIEHIRSGGVSPAGSRSEATVARCGEVRVGLRGGSAVMTPFYL